MVPAAAVETGVGPWRRRLSYVQDACLIIIAALFFYVHGKHVAHGSLSNLPFAVEQGILVVIFLTRRRSQKTSSRPMDWVFATTGGWLPLAVQVHPAPTPFAGYLGSGLQSVGLMLAIIGFLYLGRSFGVVAANRGLKVNGPYRFVRHPIYFAHTVTLTGFLLANFAPVNLAIFVVVVFSHLMRIRAEERILIETTNYATYRERVRWRLLPGIY
ncbi:MAG: hypothetical protein Kow0010_10470 [Dehalococcoidia bacterium]